MKDDAESMPATLTHLADPVAQMHTMVAAGSPDRAAVHREYDSVALSERHHFDAALHSGSLFGQHEFTALEVFSRIGEQNRHLQRENVLAVQVLVQTIIVAGPVLQ